MAGSVDRVDGIDVDTSVIETAASARPCAGKVSFEVRGLADLPAAPAYDIVTAVAVVHHMPLDAVLTQMRSAPARRSATRHRLLPQRHPRRRCARSAGDPRDMLVGFLAHANAERARVAMSAPTTGATMTLRDIRNTASWVLPGARIRRRLFWRYSGVYTESPRAV